ncbi:MAG: HIT family protein [Polyangiaceae bacterium]
MKRIPRTEAIAWIEAEAVRARGCPMCGTARGERPTWHRLGESEHAVAVLDRLATTRGHSIVIAKRHVERVRDFTREEYLDLQALVRDMTERLEEKLEPTRVYIASLGSPTARPTTFPHIHFHLVPIFGTDDHWRPARIFTWQEGGWIYDDAEAAAHADTLRLPIPARAAGPA